MASAPGSIRTALAFVAVLVLYWGFVETCRSHPEIVRAASHAAAQWRAAPP